MLPAKEREKIEKWIKLLKEVSVERGATEAEVTAAQTKIADLEAKLVVEEPPEPKAKTPKKLSPVEREKRIAEGKAALAAFSGLLNKEHEKYNMGQHYAVIGDIEDSDYLSRILQKQFDYKRR